MQEVVFGCLLLVPFSWSVVQAGRSARSKAAGGNSGFFLKKKCCKCGNTSRWGPLSVTREMCFFSK